MCSLWSPEDRGKIKVRWADLVVISIVDDAEFENCQVVASCELPLATSRWASISISRIIDVTAWFSRYKRMNMAMSIGRALLDHRIPGLR